MRVAVTGANGFLGGAAVALLAARGDAPLAVLRDGRACPLGAEARRVAEYSDRALRVAFDGAEVIVHAASVVHRPGAREEEYTRFNVDGTRAVIAAAAAVGARKLVLLSTIKVHGEATPDTIDEATPCLPELAYAATKWAAEGLVSAASSLAPVVLRLCPVYGRGDKGNVRAVARAIARRRFFVPGAGATRKSLVHVSTVADVIHAAVHAERAGVYVVADRHAPSMRELADLLAAALGRARPRSVPASALRAVASVGDAILRVAGRPTTLAALVDKSQRPSVCSPAKVERELGVACTVPLADALRDEVAWLRAEGAL